ncbi:MAG TPA: cupin domain-containing protein [Candidatus Limnocylindria bacterium]|nr:cupin domain-containing protein [Candidatus Limnocylindria bacterium]
MEHAGPYVIRADEGEAGPLTSGMDRRTLMERPDAWVGVVRTEAGVAGGWHHHADHDSYIFVLEGALTIDFGPGGRESVVAGPGDFIFNPAGIVHRERTSADGPGRVFVVRVGGGPHIVNVEGPEAEAPPG